MTASDFMTKAGLASGEGGVDGGLADPNLSEADFVSLRTALLALSPQMSCPQILDLADLLHTSIRSRKPYGRSDRDGASRGV
ncbi:MAG: hypothetical protein EON96_00025 [Caulobacteraceae bacterium]|nr:MAG: hypothetical protein EON96_00025 [Caulobacteraceae bacterium]